MKVKKVHQSINQSTLLTLLSRHGAKRPQSGAKRPVSGRNVQMAKRTGGKTSSEGAKRPVTILIRGIAKGVWGIECWPHRAALARGGKWTNNYI